MLTWGGALQLDVMTPMAIAASKGHLAVVRSLVNAGADIAAKVKVSERRVGGKRQRIRLKKDSGEW